MADASSSAMRAKKIPDNLYELCLTNLVNYLQKSKCDRNVLQGIPDTVRMDVYYKILFVSDDIAISAGMGCVV
uniref:SFRICE_013538 n=1 Tax=Spodoptera frugiperda TaxID=7108 RepID=A0A2H1VGQ7_SPOFR